MKLVCIPASTDEKTTLSTAFELVKCNLNLYTKRKQFYLLMRTSQPDLKDIVKEIRVLGGKIDKLEKIVEGRLVGEIRSDKYERKAIAEFERKRKDGKLEFAPL